MNIVCNWNKLYYSFICGECSERTVFKSMCKNGAQVFMQRMRFSKLEKLTAESNDLTSQQINCKKIADKK